MPNQTNKRPSFPLPERQVTPAVIDWQEDGSPYSPLFDDIYFSRAGGLAETEHVFLQANELQQRWLKRDQALKAEMLDEGGSSEAQPHRDTFILYELGFGTGLNFLACWRLWQQTAPQHLRLHYVSCEKHPLTLADLTRALQQWPELAEWRDQLLAQYHDHTAGCHRLVFANITLDLYFGDALAQLASHPAQQPADCWFLDGFTPPHNPELWQDELLTLIARRAAPGTTVSSYSVTGRVVRALKGYGFLVEKPPGFGHKRQMLKATMQVSSSETDTGQQTAEPQITKEQITKEQTATEQANRRHSTTGSHKHQHIVVIGAGLAGATTAYALAKRGYAVTVIDSAQEVASGASGNPAAVVQLRLNRQADALWQFHLHCFLYAQRFYHRVNTESEQRIRWSPCGVLTLNSAYAKTRRSFEPGEFSHYPDSALTELTAAECQERTGLDLGEPGLYLPNGGTIDPKATTRYCLDQPGITVKLVHTVTALRREQQRWLLCNQDNETVATADIVILANSYGIQQFDVSERFPVTPLRGQISQIPATPDSQSLKPVICSERYLTPAQDGYHCVGASYVKGSHDAAISVQEHRENRDKLGITAEALQLPEDTPSLGRASFRGSSGDYLPLAGAIPDPLTPQRQYGSTRHLPDVAQTDNTISHLPGLFMNAGHGSHGSVSCPLLAEHIAAMITGEPSPLSQELADLVDPWRFDQREQKRLRKENKAR